MLGHVVVLRLGDLLRVAPREVLVVIEPRLFGTCDAHRLRLLPEGWAHLVRDLVETHGAVLDLVCDFLVDEPLLALPTRAYDAHGLDVPVLAAYGRVVLGELLVEPLAVYVRLDVATSLVPVVASAGRQRRAERLAHPVVCLPPLAVQHTVEVRREAERGGVPVAVRAANGAGERFVRLLAALLATARQHERNVNVARELAVLPEQVGRGGVVAVSRVAFPATCRTGHVVRLPLLEAPVAVLGVCDIVHGGPRAHESVALAVRALRDALSPAPLALVNEHLAVRPEHDGVEALHERRGYGHPHAYVQQLAQADLLERHGSTRGRAAGSTRGLRGRGDAAVDRMVSTFRSGLGPAAPPPLLSRPGRDPFLLQNF